MANVARKSFFSSLKNWIQQYQITVINSAVTVILIGIVIAVLLFRASALQRKTAEESMINLAGMTANQVQSYYLSNFDVSRTLAKVMSNFNTIEVKRRRTFMYNLMLSILSSNRSFFSVYTLWKPNALDGRDAEFVGAEGSGETGQYIAGFTRERGWIEQRAFNEFKYLLDIDYEKLNLLNGMISEPVPLIFGNRVIWCVDIQVPIVYEDKVYGVIGMTINLDQLQFLVEPIKPYKTGHTMVSSKNGTVFAHNNAQLRGMNFLRPDDRDPLFSRGMFSLAYQTVQDSLHNGEPAVLRTDDFLVVSYPLKTINPLTGSYSYNEHGDAHWAVITTVPMATILEPINTLLRFSLLFIAGAGAVAALVVFLTSSGLTRQTRLLQHDLERAMTMQDNLKYGIFLMDQKLVIQGVYSKALEKIMSLSNLQGKVFLDLLASSIKAQEKDGLADYFEMIFKNAFEKQMLEEINPINVFTYVSVETGETKSLRTNFTLAERGRGTSYILCTMEDISAEKALEKQLLEAENQKEKEMRSIFQVIQLNPRVLSDFIEDAEYEFNKINELLKNKTHFHREVLVEMYQSIHAVKSNALILNLENFSARLHKLEASIKGLQEKYEDFVPFDDFLSLVLELENTMKEKDQLKAAISKIQNFKTLSGDDNSQERYVLVETLTQVCKKTQDALNRKVRFVVEEIDEAVLDYGPRRIIKEVLTQLVRNAVYHGIEDPEKREQEGKEAEGEIRLSIKYRDNQIIMTLADNGRGIDFNKIRQTAESFNLFSTPAEANDINNLLEILFSPGFSTTETADLHAGRGMGLSLVKDRIKELKGNIKVSTTQGKGTRFTITIPLEMQAKAKAS